MTEQVFNMGIIALAALIPLIVGFIWYNPKVFGKAWMSASGLTEDKIKGANMPVMFGLTFIFSILIGLVLANLAIHQNGVFSLFLGDEEAVNSFITYFNANMPGWENNYRTFGHGMVHGFAGGLIFALPIIAINAIFERRGAKYIAINAGYWILCLMLMGGVICQFS